MVPQFPDEKWTALIIQPRFQLKPDGAKGPRIADDLAAGNVATLGRAPREDPRNPATPHPVEEEAREATVVRDAVRVVARPEPEVQNP